jgi:hypothetical protein
MNNLLDVYGLWVAGLLSQSNPVVAWTRWGIGVPPMQRQEGPGLLQRWPLGMPPPRATLLPSGASRAARD